MKRFISRMVIFGLILIATTACSKTPRIKLSYFRGAKYTIPKQIKNIGIAEFGSSGNAGSQWGEITSDRIEARLDAYNRKYKRYQLVDRRRLKAIMDERDLQMAISDTSSASKAGSIANCDAMIYGNVKIVCNDRRKSRKVMDYKTNRMKTIWYMHRYCVAVANLTMDNISTSKTLASISLTREYDSDKKTINNDASKLEKFASILDNSPKDLPPASKTISNLIDQCVNEFVARISPHEVFFMERLLKGDTELVKNGNKLAEVGDYREAIEVYLRAIDMEPADHEAMFNTGVMYEKLRQLDKAIVYYNKAIKIEPASKYYRARKRAKVELKK